MITNAVQQLKHRCLAIDFFLSTEMEIMHESVVEAALQDRFTQLTVQHLDYYEIEVSYTKTDKDYYCSNTFY